jgi:hypothetical protein
MTSGAKKVAWIVGLLAGAAGVGGTVYYFTKSKKEVAPLPPKTPMPTAGGTVITPTATPGIYAAFAPYSPNVSWVDEHGNPIGGGGGGLITATQQ